MDRSDQEVEHSAWKGFKNAFSYEDEDAMMSCQWGAKSADPLLGPLVLIVTDFGNIGSCHQQARRERASLGRSEKAQSRERTVGL